MVSATFSSAVLLALASSSLAAPTKQAASAIGSGTPLSLADVTGYGFTKSVNWDFSSLQSLPAGLSVSLDKISAGDSPFSQAYTATDVYVQGGVLNMRVPGGQKGPVIQGSQIVTTDKLLYGSVRTTAKVSSVAGTCHGFFSYNNANLEETDIEILTANLTTGVHYTNQRPSYAPASNQAHSVTTTRPLPQDATLAFHEYRTDWLPGKVRWYLDGALQAELDTWAPTQATPWLWNNWSNGDDGWSGGPPVQDSVLQIRRIEMFYNGTSA